MGYAPRAVEKSHRRCGLQKRRARRAGPRFRAARLPAALKIVGTSLLLIPLSPLFMAPLAHGGVLAELHTLLPKLVLS